MTQQDWLQLEKQYINDPDNISYLRTDLDKKKFVIYFWNQFDKATRKKLLVYYMEESL